MKIVHVDDYFLPNAGYQINIIPKYQSIQGHDVTIVTSKIDGINKPNASFFGSKNIERDDKKYELETGVKIIRVSPLTKKLISNRIIQSNKFFKVIDDLNPDIVFCHGNDTLTGIRMILKYKQKKYPIVFDSHMLEMASKNKFNKVFYKLYKNFITPIIIKNNLKVIRTQNDDFVENYLGIPLSQCPWISYGSDLLKFYPNEEVNQKFRKENNISNDDFIVLYTGKLDEAKGGKLLAETFKRKFNTKRNIILVAVGDTYGEYGYDVEETFKESDNKIIRFPTQNYQNLPVFYQCADLVVFPRQCSLSFYDAQACGVPVLSENNNINVDRNSNNNGFCFLSGDINDFINKIVMCAEMNKDDYEKIRENSIKFIKDNYNYENISRMYTDILIKEYERYHLK